MAIKKDAQCSSSRACSMVMTSSPKRLTQPLRSTLGETRQSFDMARLWTDGGHLLDSADSFSAQLPVFGIAVAKQQPHPQGGVR